MHIRKEIRKAVIIYLITWVLFFVGIVLLMFFRSNESLLKSITRFFKLLPYLDFLISVHVFFVSIYTPFLLIRYFFRVYKKRGLSTSLKQIGLWLLFSLLILIVSYKIIDSNNSNERYEYVWDYSVENTSSTSKNLYATDGKHRGMHVFGFGGTSEKGVSDLVKTNIEWDTWFESYRKNMILYAQLAEQNNVELLCIGTELRTSIKHQPLAWQDLIKDIKKVYFGKLTYAANWDDDIGSYTFWEALDYVGVQAYFPLTKDLKPKALLVNCR